MKNLLAILLALSTAATAWCQAPAPVIQWQKSLGGSNTEDAYAIRVTSDGGYILVGSSYSSDGQVTGHHGTNSNVDYWVVKLDDTGGIQWENSFGGSGDDIGNSIQQTMDSGYIVAGASESLDGDLSTCNIAEYDYWLLKLSPAGAIEWKSCFGGSGIPGFNKGYFVQETPDSNFIVAGFTNAADSGEVEGFHGGGGDYWVIKVSSTGNFLWGKCLGGSGNDVASCIQCTADGGYIVAGYSSSTNGQVTGNHGSTDYWVVKLDDTGGIQWENSYGGTTIDKATYIRQTYDGGYVVAGESFSDNDQVTGHHGDTTTSDYWVIKIDDTGALQWQTSLGGTQNDAANSIQQTADSGYIVAGASNSVDGDVTGNHGDNDFWITKLSKAGALQWQKSMGGAGADLAYSVQQTADSGYVVAGASDSSSGDVTGNHGEDDYWVVKLSACQLATPPTILRTGLVLRTAIPYTSYKWELNGTIIPGATSATYTIHTNGRYTVIVSDTNACIGVSPVADTVLGVKTVLNSKTIAIMPNPTTGMINISGAGPVDIAIYNTVGQLVKQALNTDKISISELPAALYFIKLSDDGGEVIYQGKVIKQ